MKIISSKVHGILDYLVGALLIVYPQLASWDYDSVPGMVMAVLGVSTILYSLLTDYELCIAPYIPFKAHLALDLISGVLLAASPWLFGFADVTWQAHLFLGLAEIAAVAMTRTEAGSRKNKK